MTRTYSSMQLYLSQSHAKGLVRPYGGLLKHPKTEGTKELFLPKNDFKNSTTLNFPKRHPDFGDLETNQRHEIQT